MKYRIKIVTFKNGRKEYIAQKKWFLFWAGLMLDGSTDFLTNYPVSDRRTALEKIDKNFAGNTTKQTIEFEYVNRG